MDIPQQWENLEFRDLKGLIMVIGGPDVGKSTFSRYLWQRLHRNQVPAGFLDGDPGQSRLGPPTTMTLALGRDPYALGPKQESPVGEQGKIWRTFVGSVSPAGHMLQMLVAASKLIAASRNEGVEALIYDTTGLIHKDQGGMVLKQSKIELFAPSVIFAIQRGTELEHILSPFRRSNRFRIIDLKPSLAAQGRSTYERREHRKAQFSKYFHEAHTVVLEWSSLGVFPRPYFTRGGLVALEDIEGFVLALGITLEVYPRDRQVSLLVPRVPLDNLVALRVGAVGLDPEGFEDHRL